MKDAAVLMRDCNLCVLSTVDANGASESALVGFSVFNEVELTIGTNRNSRKFKNITQNPRVSLVIGWEKKTVQYEGTARELTGQELQDRQKEHLVKNPGAEKYRDEPGQVYISISPTWIRFTDATVLPWRVEERKFS